MSRQRLLSSLAAICGALIVTARLAMLYFPISAPAQEVVKGEANLLHRAPLEYPADAIEKGIQGTVLVEATLNERGEVNDARVISGPEPLRKAALRSVLEWHYSAQAQSPVEVAIDFKLPSKAPARGVIGSVPGGLPAGVPGGIISPRPTVSPAEGESGRLSRIQISSVSPALREALTGRIPAQVGDEIQADTLSRVRQAVRDVDEHLDARLTRILNPDGGKEFALQIISTAPMALPASSSAVQRIRVGGNVQAANVLYNPRPAYPAMAKQARIQGVVRLNVTISKEGTVQDIQVASGHPLLVDAATDAVRLWVYKPTLLNSEPVEVVTVVDVNFTLSQ